MMPAPPLVAVAMLASGLTAALLARLVVPPTRRLADRVRPYAVSARISLGRSADVGAVARPALDSGVLRRLLAAPAEALAARVGRLTGHGGEHALRLRLRQAQLFPELSDERRVLEYRVRQLAATVAGALAGLGASLALPAPGGLVVLVTLLGSVVGATRWKGRLDRAVDARRARMRVELYTVNQLLAINVRVGGGVVQALRRVVDRGNGTLVDDLREVLVAHESGRPAREALLHAAAVSPEPHVARTYRLLAMGAELGADLADALLSHSEDIREARREALRRAATRRRAAMLLPIVGILAPVMLLFIAAPLPSLILGGLR